MVSRSNIEVEYQSIAVVSQKILWLQSLLDKLNLKSSQPHIIDCEIVSVILFSSNPIIRSRTKHFKLNLYFIKEKIQVKYLKVICIPSIKETMVILTKPTTIYIFLRYRTKLRVHNSSHMSWEVSVIDVNDKTKFQVVRFVRRLFVEHMAPYRIWRWIVEVLKTLI